VLRGAFIGFGNVASHGHLPAWQSRKDVRIVAATDMLAARRDEFVRACPGGRWYASVDELLATEKLDFVDICTPPSIHAALIRQALDADLHVLCEKPLVTRLADASGIAAAAAKRGRLVHTVHNWLKAPACERISGLIDDGAIGSIRSIHWRTLRTQPALTAAPAGHANWRLDPVTAGGGILLDHGWHALYCLTRWAGAPHAIAAVLEKRRFPEWPLEDTATVVLDFNPGTGEIHLTWAGEVRSNHIEIEGEQGRIKVVNERVVLRTRSGENEWCCPPALSEGSHHLDWFTRVAEDFSDAAANGGKDNLDEAFLCARLIDLAQRSSIAGGIRLAVGP
jgi:predicted dehydrogenase